MAGATSRFDFFVGQNGELIKRKSVRSSKHRPWPKPEPEAAWAVSIEHHEGIRRTKGPLWTRRREADAIVQVLYPRSTSTDLGRRIPDAVRDGFSARFTKVIDDVTQSVGRRWRQLHTENAMVGVLVGALDGVAFDLDGWSVTVDAQTFSDKVKEPVIGADLGWRVEVREGEEETVKALLMQAKKANTLDAWPDLPDLASQMGDMQKVTDDSYGLIFTPQGIMTAGRGQVTTLTTTIVETVRCRRGDPSPTAVANAIDAKHFVQVDFQGPADEE